MARTVLITGASGGIGGAAARMFAAKGDRVILHYYQNEAAVRQLAAELSELADVLPLRADVRERAQVDAMFDAAAQSFGEVDVLVNNAGIAQQKLFTDLTESDFRAMLDTHVTGAFHCIQRALPAMIRKKRGCIVNVTSIWGVVGGACEVHYSAAKAALVGMTGALAKEVGPSGVRVNAVAPGVIGTAMTGKTAATKEELRELCALGRLGTPEEAANAILFLASEEASFITGQVLGVDGGWF